MENKVLEELRELFNRPFPVSQEEMNRVIKNGHRNIDALYNNTYANSTYVEPVHLPPNPPIELTWHLAPDSDYDVMSDYGYLFKDYEEKLKKYNMPVNTNPVVIIE